MKLLPKTLRVFPNPWGVNPAALHDDQEQASRKERKLNPVDHSTMDHEGRPCGVVMANPLDGGRKGRLLGAEVCDVNTTFGKSNEGKAAVMAGDIWRQQQRTVYSFLGRTAHETKPYELAEKLSGAEPVVVRSSKYYLDELATGALIAADEKTAQVAGQKFEEPKTLFLKLAKAAAVAFDAHYEDAGAYEQFVADRAEAAAEKSGDAESIALGRDASNAPRLNAFDAAAQAAAVEESAKSEHYEES